MRHKSFDLIPPPPDNTLRLSVSLAVDVSELATWKPETARAFMAGLAQVITAQNAAT